MRVVQRFLQHVLPGVMKPLMVLWNEVIGFIFLVLAAFIGVATYRRVQNFNGDAGGVMIVVCSFIFAAVLAAYGVGSFRKARKITRS